MKKVFWGISVLFLYQSVQATNIRVIGNGGGGAEMLALTVLSEVKGYIKVCLRNENPCDLLPTQLAELKQLNMEDQRLEIERLGPEVWNELQNLGFSDLVSVFLAYVGTQREQSWGALQDIPNALKALAHLLFQDMTWNRSELVLADEQKMERIRLIWTDGRVRGIGFFYDYGDGNSEDLISPLASVLMCQGEAHIREIGPQIRIERQGFVFPAVWSCGESLFRATVMGRRESDKTWKFQTFARSLIDSSECSTLLEPPHKRF